MSEKREHVGRKVEQEIRIEAPAMDVWKAWADADGIARWFVDRCDGDAKAGEVVTWHFDPFGFHQPTPVVEATPGASISYGADIPGRLPILLEVTLRQDGGATVLRLVNSGFSEEASDWDEEYEGTASGWGMALATLKHVLERCPAEAPRTHVLAMRPAAFAWDGLQPLFDTADGLRRWLADEVDGDEPLTEGSAVRMRLKDGGTLTGRVLARTPIELLLSWEEQNAVLGLKGFQKPPEGYHVALDFNAWPLAGGETEDGLKGRLDAALERLAGALG